MAHRKGTGALGQAFRASGFHLNLKGHILKHNCSQKCQLSGIVATDLVMSWGV